MAALRKTAATIVSTVLSGCCALAPCHSAAHLTGRIVSASGVPISGAVVSLYSGSTTSNASGCFTVGGADALPFKLVVSADGYKPLRVAPRLGHFEVSVVLAPIASGSDSLIDWKATPRSSVHGDPACT